jgi:hypothetical protein
LNQQTRRVDSVRFATDHELNVFILSEIHKVEQKKTPSRSYPKSDPLMTDIDSPKVNRPSDDDLVLASQQKSRADQFASEKKYTNAIESAKKAIILFGGGFTLEIGWNGLIKPPMNNEIVVSFYDMTMFLQRDDVGM